MLKLCGFPVSNYYNKVKIALLEKGVPFEEEYVPLRDGVKRLDDTPTRKVPFLDTGHGVLAESHPICEYIEELYPQPALMPADPLARARVRELSTVLELYLEWPARRLYREAFFGGTVSDETKHEAREQIEKGAVALARLARFSPFIAGEQLTLADCAASVHLPIVAIATRKMYGQNLLEGIPAIPGYLKALNEREAFRKTHEDRKLAEAAMAAARGAR